MTQRSTCGSEDWHVQMLAQVNSHRAAHGVHLLTLDSTLCTAAQRHSNDQAARGRLGHEGSDGSSVGTRVKSAGYQWRSVAENVGYFSYKSTVGAAVEMWKGSQGHNANMLSRSYSSVGFGYSVSGDGSSYWTQVFAS